MPRPRQIIFLALLAVSFGLFTLPGGLLGSVMPSALADGTFNVNSSGDAPDSDTSDGVCNDGSNRCTLRAAIQQANATSGGSTINVAALGTITLTSALPDINANISIIGPGARLLTVSGADSFRVFNVANSAVNFTVSGITITGGRAGSGAGLNNSGGQLTVINCVITNNTATGFGGGINNNNGGKLSVTNTTIAYNSANSAGGLFNIGLATIADSTISFNTSATNGGGAENVGTMFVLLSDTIYGNSAQNAGGGIHNPGIGVLDFSNTVVAGNSAGSSGPDIDGANLVSHDYNLVENTSGADISGTTAHNITGTAPALGPLQHNGGATLTQAPPPGSAVIDRGNASVFSPLTLDQRGLTRPVDLPSVANAAGGDGADIGAFEIQSGEALTVNSLADTFDGQCNTQNCTLREAIIEANATAGYNSINFSVTGTINLTGALPDISTDLAIDGPGAKSLTVKRNTSEEYRVFSVTSGASARISGLTVTGGFTNDAFGGGGILNKGTLVLTGVAVADNYAYGGGGIKNDGTLTLLNSTLSGNTTNFGGGGGVFNNGPLTVINSTLSGNSGGSGSGGGILSFGAVTLTNTTVAGNQNRGVMCLGSSCVTVLSSSIVANNLSTDPGQTDIGNGGGGTFVSNGYNLIRTPNSVGINEASNPGTNIYNQDPKLGPLADNGGPTQTHALLSGSPAIDKGRDFAKGFFFGPAPRDQRGAARPYDFSAIAPPTGGDNSDMGAFELRPVAETPSSKAVNEDSTLTFNFFAGDQTVTSISATSGDQTLVPDSNINVTGGGPERTIQVTPAANRSGSVTITISLNGSVEGATTRSFRLTVNPVNDAPTFVKGADQTVLEDAGPQTVSNWATSIGAGPGESSQAVNFSVTGDTNPSLFSAAPSVNASGALTFTPAPDANGSATITIVLKDDGGTLNGGQDTSAAQTFVINVTAVNDAPVANSQTVATDEDTPKAITLTGSDVDGDALTFQIVSGPSHGTLTGTGAGRTYTPAADFNGADSFTFKAVDPSNAESAPATVNVNVAAVNDAPVNTVPGAQLTARDTPLVFSASNSNAVSVSDVDAAANALRVTLTSTNGTLTLGGTSGLTFSAGDGADDSTMTFKGTAANVNAALNGLTFKPSNGFDGAASLQITTDDQGNTGSGGAKGDTDTVAITVARSVVEFAQSSYTVAETAGSLNVTVRRLGDTSQAASVDYATDDGTNNGPVVPCSSVTGLALARCDYTKAVGTLRFAAGETEKPIVILISDDSYTEGPETAHVTLANAGGVATLGARTSATFEITDDSPESATNPIDDSTKFVRQHYHDFLNREPDAAGLQFWTNEIEKCGQDAQCREVRRINVSAAFFQSIEFQETGYFVYRTYKTAYGDATSPNVPGTVPVVRFDEFLVDTQEIGRGVVVGVGDWQNQLNDKKQAFVLAFAQRPRFATEYPSTLSPAQFVDRLNANTGGVLTQDERDTAVNTLSADNTTHGRAVILSVVAEKPLLRQREFNRAFVLMEYYGYMRRNPDDAPDADFRGWKFWLDKLNQFNGNFVQAEMVKAFLASDEYRTRFGQ